MELDWPIDIGCQTHEVLDSTNTEAKRLALQNHPSTWVFAHQQKAGRGSRGRTWTSEIGNFTSSLLFYPKGKLLEFSFRSFIAGLALYETVLYFGVKQDRLLLKWPNDLLLDKKKLSGILLEAVSLDHIHQPNALVVGFGLNLATTPKLSKVESNSPIALIEVLGENTPSAHELLILLARRFSYWEKVYLERGFEAIRSAWLNYTIPLGFEIMIKNNYTQIKGSFSGINNYGELILLTKTGEKCFSVADVFF